jgi:hypothetical protein
LGLLAALACGGEGSSSGARAPERAGGELALPPSATAPRVMNEAATPDTLLPDTISSEFAIDAIAGAYRAHYAGALEREGSAVRNRIDRDLQHEAERRTALDQGFGDWVEMVGALTPEQRVRLVERLDAANIELARELHGSGEGPPVDGTGPAD